MTLSGHLKPAYRERLQGGLLSIGTHGMLALCAIYFSFRFFPFLEHGYTQTWSRVSARVWAFFSMIAVLFASLTHKRRSNRHSAPPFQLAAAQSACKHRNT